MSDDDKGPELEVAQGEEEVAAQKAKAAEDLRADLTKHGENLADLYLPRIYAVARRMIRDRAEALVGEAKHITDSERELRIASLCNEVTDEDRRHMLTIASQVVASENHARSMRGIQVTLEAIGAMLAGPPQGGPSLLTPTGQLHNPNRVNGKRRGKRK